VGVLVRRFLRDELVNEVVDFQVLGGFVAESLGAEVLRIDKRECLIDEDRGVRENAVAQNRAREHIGAILAHSAHLWVRVEEFFETPLVFEKPGKIFRGTER